MERHHQPSTPLLDKGLNTKQGILEAHRASQTPNLGEQVNGKFRDIFNNRRKFLSKGFIGSALAMAGSASITRGGAEAAIANSEEIFESPKYLKEVPPAARRIPGFVEEKLEGLAEELPRMPKRIQEFSEYTASEISATKVETATCPRTDGEIHKHKYVNIPFSDTDVCAFWERSYYAFPGHEKLDDKEKDNRLDEYSTKTSLRRVGFGMATAAAGAALLRSNGQSEELDRRELFKRMKTGAFYGIVWSFIDEKAIESVLPIPKKGD